MNTNKRCDLRMNFYFDGRVYTNDFRYLFPPYIDIIQYHKTTQCV